MGSPQVEERRALDPSVAGYIDTVLGPRISQMHDKPITSVGPRDILGESPDEQYFRSLGIGKVRSDLDSFSALSPTETNALNFTNSTISGAFLDPTKSPVYQSIADSIQRKALETSQLSGDYLNAGFAKAGQTFSSPLLGARNQLAERTAQGVSDTLAGYLMPLYQQNLAYQQNALPMSMRFGDIQRDAPLRYLDLADRAYSMAGIPRGIEQMRLDEMFQAAQRARSAQLEPFQLGLGFLGGVPQTNSIVQQSDFERIGLPLLLGMIQASGRGRGRSSSTTDSYGSSGGSSGGGGY